MFDFFRFVIIIVCALAIYAICGIPFGLLLARALRVDLRRVGSGNIGATNVARTLGGKLALLTLALDILKGYVSCLLAFFITDPLFGGAPLEKIWQSSDAWLLALFFLAAVGGHIFSPYLNFKGGKGIAVGVGSACALMWPAGIAALIVFLLLVIPSRLVSLGSVGAAISLPIFALIFVQIRGDALWILCFVSFIVLWAHRQNIVRLLAGTEKRFASSRTKRKKRRSQKRR